MAITQLHFSDLKSGRLEDRVVTSLLRFWEARNFKKSGELMSVDFIFLNEKCRRHSKITGKKVTVGLISATPLNATLLFPTAALEHKLDLELEEIHFLDTIPIVFEFGDCNFKQLQLQTHTWCEAGSSQGVKRESLEENPWLQEKYRATTVTTFKTIGGNAETLESSFVGSKRKHGNGGETHFNELSNGDTGKTTTVSRGELTFQDIYGAEALLNEEDEDGYSDWEPVQQKMPVEFVKWCCFNCTMANPASAIICLRHMDILHLCYLKDTVPHYLTSSNTKQAHVSFILILGNSSAASSTAVGFEEIILLHSEVYTLEHVNFTSQLLYSQELRSSLCLSSGQIGKLLKCDVPRLDVFKLATKGIFTQQFG
ncbi:hypothetical protein F2Q69_00051189 [Brassica cretica]|uniref:Uncharacterized protein n=1 Tax=Brassica cretica TaxID=69181 RepID=A0A8S9PMH2_BRACR|nr:hypothetical protein F2Q69_00051189 [Brassica cretica]